MVDRTDRRQQQNAGSRRKRRPVHGRRSHEMAVEAARQRAREARERKSR